MNRYSRHIMLSEIGSEGQNKISNAKVLVVGAGGLGCPVLQYLTSAGVGTIGIIDHDIVEESNLQRQVLFGTSDIGKKKALVAKERLEDLNPTIKIIAFPEQLTSNNCLDIFKQFNIIVDGTDNFEARYLINDAAIILNKPVVFGAIYKFEGQISVFNYKNGPSYRCLFPKKPKAGTVLNCSEIGVLGVLPGIIGSMQANEVLKIILNIGNLLSGKLLCYNAKSATVNVLSITRNESEIQNVLKNKHNFNNTDYTIDCNVKPPDVTVKDISKLNNVVFLDVREPYENPKFEIDNYIQIPLGELKEKSNSLPKNKTLIVFCQSGIRSMTAVRFLRENKFDNCYSLKESAFALSEQLNVESL